MAGTRAWTGGWKRQPGTAGGRAAAEGCGSWAGRHQGLSDSLLAGQTTCQDPVSTRLLVSFTESGYLGVGVPRTRWTARTLPLSGFSPHVSNSEPRTGHSPPLRLALLL